jgi:hypothetical protein
VSEAKKLQDQIIDETGNVHALIYLLQNSGEVDEHECSELLMMADDLREKCFELFDKWNGIAELEKQEGGL